MARYQRKVSRIYLRADAAFAMGKFDAAFSRGIVLDMDSSVSPTHGEQEMSASISLASAILFRLSREFGLSPKARAALGPPPASGGSGRFDGLLGG